jgi:hypothetical protein
MFLLSARSQEFFSQPAAKINIFAEVRMMNRSVRFGFTTVAAYPSGAGRDLEKFEKVPSSRQGYFSNALPRSS